MLCKTQKIARHNQTFEEQEHKHNIYLNKAHKRPSNNKKTKAYQYQWLKRKIIRKVIRVQGIPLEGVPIAAMFW